VYGMRGLDLFEMHMLSVHPGGPEGPSQTPVGGVEAVDPPVTTAEQKQAVGEGGRGIDSAACGERPKRLAACRAQRVNCMFIRYGGKQLAVGNDRLKHFSRGDLLLPRHGQLAR
jgi:hypothetical protein